MTYELYYWDGIQGRGEFVRLVLEDAKAPYVDVTREPERGTAEMMSYLRSVSEPRLPFAPPFLRDGHLIISHVANILNYLGPKLDLSPSNDADRWFANGLQLTITDFVAEVHDTHHPIATSKYFEEQKPEAIARTTEFVRVRLPKFLGYFERVLQQNPVASGYLVGGQATYVDLSIFQLIEGLCYAFPKAMRDHAERYPGLSQLHDTILKRPAVNAYINSPRRLPFSEAGIFRRYPALDIAP